MRIREIEPKDNPHIARIVRDNLEQKSLAIPGTAYFDPQLDSLYQYYESLPDAAYWVLVDDNEQVLGGVGVARFQGTTAELQKLYLADEAKGHGCGSQLLDFAICFAEKNFEALYLETFKVLDAANHLYRSRGFDHLEAPLGNSGHNACDTWLLKDLKA